MPLASRAQRVSHTASRNDPTGQRRPEAPYAQQATWGHVGVSTPRRGHRAAARREAAAQQHRRGRRAACTAETRPHIRSTTRAMLRVASAPGILSPEPSAP